MSDSKPVINFKVYERIAGSGPDKGCSTRHIKDEWSLQRDDKGFLCIRGWDLDDVERPVRGDIVVAPTLERTESHNDLYYVYALVEDLDLGEWVAHIYVDRMYFNPNILDKVILK